MDEFLNPKSMLTPGACGGVVMMITSALYVGFGFPQMLTALIFSFLVGTIIFTVASQKLWQTIVLYIINSLIIFATATGMNGIGKKTNIASLLEPSAVYADPISGNVPADSKINPGATSQVKVLEEKIKVLEEKIEQVEKEKQDLQKKLQEKPQLEDASSIILSNEQSIPKQVENSNSNRKFFDQWSWNPKKGTTPDGVEIFKH